jgi:putative FmdB family regulatory protein
MPTYSYLCEGCGQSFELEQRISEDPIKKCVLCGQAKARRQIVSGNFILKGGGWYSDGYGSSKKSTKAEASASSGTKADKPESATKSDKAEGGASKPDSSAAKGGESKATAAE